MNQTILLTGATASVGKATLLELLKGGDNFKIKLLVRPSKINAKNNGVCQDGISI